MATALLAAGLALAFATLRAATATVDRGEALVADSERIRAVQGFLRSRLASAHALAFEHDPSGPDPVYFIGGFGKPGVMQLTGDLTLLQAISMQSSVSVSEPIWFSFTRIELA